MTDTVERLQEPFSEAVRRYAMERGYTELHFNPKTMSWAWYKPDQVIGEDGRLYIRCSGQ